MRSPVKISKHLAIVTALSALLMAALSGCGGKESTGLEFESNGDGTCTWVGLGTCSDTEIIVPAKNGEDTVTAVGPEVLGRRDGITKVVLPDTVKILKEKALSYNDDLLAIDFGSGLETIGDYGVAYCEKLEKAPLPDSVRTIGNGAFTDDEALTEILIPEGVEDVGSYAFSYTSSVRKIRIPASMNEFRSYNFCTDALEEIEFKGENRYFDFNTTEPEEGSQKPVRLSGRLCQDAQKTDSPSSYYELSEKSYPAVLCAMLGKDTIKLNGKTVARTTEPEAGAYTAKNESGNLVVTENQEIAFVYSAGSADGSLTMKIPPTKYERNAETGEITVDGAGTVEISFENVPAEEWEEIPAEQLEALKNMTYTLKGVLVPLGDNVLTALETTISGLEEDRGMVCRIWSQA